MAKITSGLSPFFSVYLLEMERTPWLKIDWVFQHRYIVAALPGSGRHISVDYADIKKLYQTRGSIFMCLWEHITSLTCKLAQSWWKQGRGQMIVFFTFKIFLYCSLILLYSLLFCPSTYPSNHPSIHPSSVLSIIFSN